MYKHGGIYVDEFYAARKSLQCILSNDDEFVFGFGSEYVVKYNKTLFDSDVSENKTKQGSSRTRTSTTYTSIELRDLLTSDLWDMTSN